jgi:hypothetical protein
LARLRREQLVNPDACDHWIYIKNIGEGSNRFFPPLFIKNLNAKEPGWRDKWPHGILDEWPGAQQATHRAVGLEFPPFAFVSLGFLLMALHVPT